MLKCWETNFAFIPEDFLNGLDGGQYDWIDLRRLVRKGWAIDAETIVRQVQDGYGFLTSLTAAEAILAIDPYGRQQAGYQGLVEQFRRSSPNA